MTNNEETLNVKLPKGMMEELREKAIKKFGYKRGYLKKASMEAIKLWIKEN